MGYDLISNKLVLGTAQFGMDYGITNKNGKISIGEIFNILNYAQSKNVIFLDTAELYGSSHESIGKYIKKTGNKFEIITKFSNLGYNLKKRIINSLDLIGVGKFYAILVHNFDEVKKNISLYKTLIEARELGLTQKIGFSLYSPEELNFLFNNKISFDIIQIPFNIFDRRFEKYFRKLKEKKVEIHVRSVFLQGLLLVEPERLKNTIFSNIIPKLFIIRNNAKKLNICLPAYVMLYVFLNELVDKMVVGIDSYNNLLLNIKSMEQINKIIKTKNWIEEIFNTFNNLEVKNKKIILPKNWKLGGKI